MEQKLNILLSDLVVEYHKLQNFHWYTKGRNFYTVHAKLEELFNSLLEVIDDIAEVMLMMECKPVGSLREFIENAQIKEAADSHLEGIEIFTHVLADFRYLHNYVVTIKTAADSEQNYIVSALMDNYIAQFAKNIWMIKQVLA